MVEERRERKRLIDGGGAVVMVVVLFVYLFVYGVCLCVWRYFLKKTKGEMIGCDVRRLNVATPSTVGTMKKQCFKIL